MIFIYCPHHLYIPVIELDYLTCERIKVQVSHVVWYRVNLHKILKLLFRKALVRYAVRTPIDMFGVFLDIPQYLSSNDRYISP